MDMKQFIIHQQTTPAKEAVSVPFPENLHPDIQTYLQGQHIETLYSHQRDFFSAVTQKEHVVITTSTASGKTLSFLLPIIQAILQNPLTRAILVYPTKALASDQYRSLLPWMEYLGEDRISAGVYDGDTGPAERTRIRKSANIILTNPEMLNTAFLPNHSRYGFDSIFSHLQFIVIDELHSYRGAFGSHLANLMRRMQRVCHYYGSTPQFLCCSATIANPMELAQKICGQTFTLISKDGSPSASKQYVILQPPVIKGDNDKVYGRVSASAVAAELIPELVENKHHFIAFGRSRRNVEVILKEARDMLDSAGFLGDSGSSLIAGYRGGYTPSERKNIERSMISGKLLGLVSTNALELGIDIGSLDTTVLVGYPGTRASFWQQTGRAGRGKQTCTNYLILENQPFDQYIAIDPDWLFQQDSESAIVDPDNLLIQLSHIRAAAAEMPLTMDDIALFPALGEVIPVLLKADELKSLAGKFAWAGPAFPAGDFSLRNMDQTRFQLLLDPDGKQITEMDESQAYHEIYPGAIYIHDGVQYEVLSLDLKSRIAKCKPFQGNYYTVPAGTEETRILQAFHEDTHGRVTQKFGDINVNEIVSMYKKLQFHNHQNLGYVSLSLPLQKNYDTESTWISLPENVVKTYRSLLLPNQSGELTLNNHFEGIQHALQHAAMMVTMASKEDIDVTLSNNALIPDYNDTEVVSLFLYDKYVGGLGYSEKIYDYIPKIIERSIQLVKHCPCEDGCPACVGDYTLDKKMVLWGLENLLEETPAPVSVKQSETPLQPSIQKDFSFFTLDTQWQTFCEAVSKRGEIGAAFLKTIGQVAIKEHTLILTLTNSFYAEWIQEKENRRTIENILRHHAVCPNDMQLTFALQSDPDQEHKRTEKLLRHQQKEFDRK